MADDDQNTSEGAQTQESTPPPPPTNTESSFIKLSVLFRSNILDAAAWCIRIYIVLLSVFYMLLGGAIPSVDSNYKRALIANALVACIRLHQRTNGSFSLTRAHMELVLREDSAHYLIFSIIFLMQPVRITMALVPIALMAMIHAVKYCYRVLDTAGWNFGRTMLNFIAVKQQVLFRLVALTEIFLMPALVVMIFLGRAQIFSPILYYRYVKLRYASQRNTYSRLVFTELRIAGDQYNRSPSLPGFVKKIITAAQNLCYKLA